MKRRCFVINAAPVCELFELCRLVPDVKTGFCVTHYSAELVYQKRSCTICCRAPKPTQKVIGIATANTTMMPNGKMSSLSSFMILVRVCQGREQNEQD